jgi:hypothetical protein
MSDAIIEEHEEETYDNNDNISDNDIHLADALFVNAIQVRVCL